jgi:DNA polymerase-3 subunit delta'
MKFKDIYGLEDVKKRLIRTVDENRISHAQLFLGTEGTGNLALALAYAQYINCRNKTDGDSCGTCPSCVKYEKLSHPDLHFVFPVAKVKQLKDKEVSSSNSFYLENWRAAVLENDAHLSLGDWYAKIGMENKQGYINTDDARSIIDKISYKSYEAEYKVMLIWMTEFLYHAAAPRLLKVIEEPPPKTLFLLVSHQSDKIIGTILSRSQTVKIPRYKEDELLRYLRKKYQAGEEEAHNAVKIANGNLVAARDAIQTSEIEMFNYEKFREWMRMCFAAKFTDISEFVVEVSQLGRERQKSFLSYGLDVIRKSMLLNYAGLDAARLSPMEGKFVQGFAPFINEKNLDQLYKEFNDAIYHIERNAKPDILFTDLSIITTKLLHAGKK